MLHLCFSITCFGMLERLALVESKDKSGSKGLTESLIVTAQDGVISTHNYYA